MWQRKGGTLQRHTPSGTESSPATTTPQVHRATHRWSRSQRCSGPTPASGTACTPSEAPEVTGALPRSRLRRTGRHRATSCRAGASASWPWTSARTGASGRSGRPATLAPSRQGRWPSTGSTSSMCSRANLDNQEKENEIPTEDVPTGDGVRRDEPGDSGSGKHRHRRPRLGTWSRRCPKSPGDSQPLGSRGRAAQRAPAGSSPSWTCASATRWFRIGSYVNQLAGDQDGSILTLHGNWRRVRPLPGNERTRTAPGSVRPPASASRPRAAGPSHREARRPGRIRGRRPPSWKLTSARTLASTSEASWSVGTSRRHPWPSRPASSSLAARYEA